MFLLDTNVISELRKTAQGRADMNVVNWAEPIPADQLFISSIVVMELEIGIGLKERKDERQGRVLREWMDAHILPFFNGRILPIDTKVATLCARLHIPNKRPERDAMIAATAILHDLTLATRNEKDFEGTGAKLINPWL